jgi:hypothetical protein
MRYTACFLAKPKPTFLPPPLLAISSDLIYLYRTLFGLMTWLHVQVVGRLEPALPSLHIHFFHVINTPSFEIHIAADRLVNPFLCTCRNFDKGKRR